MKRTMITGLSRANMREVAKDLGIPTAEELQARAKAELAKHKDLKIKGRLRPKSGKR